VPVLELKMGGAHRIECHPHLPGGGYRYLPADSQIARNLRWMLEEDHPERSRVASPLDDDRKLADAAAK
jgi:hypothetical protein